MMWYQRYFKLKLILLFMPALFVSGISLFSLLPKEVEATSLPVSVVVEEALTAVDDSAPLLLAEPTTRFTIEVARETAVSDDAPFKVSSSVKAMDTLSGAVGKSVARSG